MRKPVCVVVLAAMAASAAPAIAADPPPAPAGQPLLQALAGQVEADQLRATIQALVGFGTRSTLSDRTSPTRGIGAAQRWAQARFEGLARACGGCLEVITPSATFTGERLPAPTPVEDVVAIQRGTSDPDRVVVITAHIDSRVSDVMNAKSDAPGADDDGSGVAAVLEAARLLSRHRFAATLVYGITAGEEQGLYGGKVLADYAKTHGWRVEADLNNDIVGDTHGQSGPVATDRVRVFSEGTRAVESPEAALRRHANGGELDSPSRNVARLMAALAPLYLKDFMVEMIYRTDRYGRGGDQIRFLEAGYPAVRVTEAAENYTRQHQDLRRADGVDYGDVISAIDFAYLAQVARLNILTLADLASAPAPPVEVKIAGAVTPDTTLSWSPSSGAVAYRVWWRATDAAQWDHSRDAGDATALTLKSVNIDDFFFGVSAVSADDFTSPVEFPGPSGAFFPAAAAASVPTR